MELTGSEPSIPSSGEQALLDQINLKQLTLDVATRKLSSLQWSLFAEWFKYKSQYIPQVGQQDVLNAYKTAVKPIKDNISGGTDVNGKPVTGLSTFIQSLQTDIANLKLQVDCKSFARDPYHLRSDPTLSIVGLDSG